MKINFRIFKKVTEKVIKKLEEESSNNNVYDGSEEMYYLSDLKDIIYHIVEKYDTQVIEEYVDETLTSYSLSDL